MIELLTGQNDTADGLTTDYSSIASLMKTAGYHTALIGKWHLGSGPEHSPVRNGFDYFFGFRSGAAEYTSHKGDAGKHDLYENDSLVYTPGYLTNLFTQKAIEYVIISKSITNHFYLHSPIMHLIGHGRVQVINLTPIQSILEMEGPQWCMPP